MNIRKKNKSLVKQIEEAWYEANVDVYHRLRPVTRLKLYDLLIDDLDVSLLDLVIQDAWKFPQRTQGLKRYYYLGILTVEHVFPIWERDIKQYIDIIMEGAPDPQVWHEFPYIIHNYTLELLKGYLPEEIKVRGHEEWGTSVVANWHYIIGNLSDSILYQHGMVLVATYDLLRAVSSLAFPIRLSKEKSLVLDQLYDDELSGNECTDFTYHAIEAFISKDPNVPIWGKSWDLPILRDKTKALSFWYWWLFEAIPQAASIDLGSVDFSMRVK